MLVISGKWESENSLDLIGSSSSPLSPWLSFRDMNITGGRCNLTISLLSVNERLVKLVRI